MAPPTAEYFQNALSQIKEKPYVPPERRPSYANTGPIERQVPSVQEPAYHPPPDSTFFITTSHGTIIPNTDFLKDHFFKEGRLTENQAMAIINEASTVLRNEPNLLNVGPGSGAVVVCGDIHGQYYDLMKLFEIGGSLEDNVYLFLGDYVDRGCFGIECLLYLYSLKIRYPTRIYMLRGNHECKHLTTYFTFQRECFRKYSQTVYEACIASFCTLPLAAILDDRFFCVHGGLSPELIKISDLEKVDRFSEPPEFGILCDLLWSDPIWNYGNEQEANEGGQAVAPGSTFVHNHTRGCSYYFTYEAVCNFLDRNGLLGVIRGHEAQNTGYAMARKTPVKKFPSVITIFSAPNYCDVYHNRGAILKYANKNITIRQFNSSSHPYWLPNFIDAFTWSLPFVGAKITEMLLAILSCCSAEELEESSSEDEAAESAAHEASLARKQEIKKKILAVGRMQKVFQLLREEAENSSELMIAVENAAGVSPGTSGAGGFVSPGALAGSAGGASMGGAGAGGGVLATGVNRRGKDELGAQGNQIRRSIRNFEDARRVDIANERIPTSSNGAIPSSSSPSTFPILQSPSTTPHHHHFSSQPHSHHSFGSGVGGSGSGSGSAAVADIEMRLRQALQENSEDEELNALAERVAGGGRRFGTRPKGLKRFETA